MFPKASVAPGAVAATGAGDDVEEPGRPGTEPRLSAETAKERTA